MRVEYVYLKSGNVYIYVYETATVIEMGIVYSQDRKFIGGFLGKEAYRKLQAFKGLDGVSVTCTTIKDASEIKNLLLTLHYKEYASKLGTASWVLENSVSVWSKDELSSNYGNACSDRYKYYRATGLNALQSNFEKIYPLVLMIANHLSLYSYRKFETTFFRGIGEGEYIGESGCNVAFIHTKTRWDFDKIGYQAPAYYIRSMVKQVLINPHLNQL